MFSINFTTSFLCISANLILRQLINWFYIHSNRKPLQWAKHGRSCVAEWERKTYEHWKNPKIKKQLNQCKWAKSSNCSHQIRYLKRAAAMMLHRIGKHTAGSVIRQTSNSNLLNTFACMRSTVIDYRHSSSDGIMLLGGNTERQREKREENWRKWNWSKKNEMRESKLCTTQRGLV